MLQKLSKSRPLKIYKCICFESWVLKQPDYKKITISTHLSGCLLSFANILICQIKTKGGRTNIRQVTPLGVLLLIFEVIYFKTDIYRKCKKGFIVVDSRYNFIYNIYVQYNACNVCCTWVKNFDHCCFVWVCVSIAQLTNIIF